MLSLSSLFCDFDDTSILYFRILAKRDAKDKEIFPPATLLILLKKARISFIQTAMRGEKVSLRSSYTETLSFLFKCKCQDCQGIKTRVTLLWDHSYHSLFLFPTISKSSFLIIIEVVQVEIVIWTVINFKRTVQCILLHPLNPLLPLQ